MAYSNRTTDRSNVIPFPVPARARNDKDSLIQEIADILSDADSRAEPRAEDQLVARLERVAEQLERMVQSAGA